MVEVHALVRCLLHISNITLLRRTLQCLQNIVYIPCKWFLNLYFCIFKYWTDMLPRSNEHHHTRPPTGPSIFEDISFQQLNVDLFKFTRIQILWIVGSTTVLNTSIDRVAFSIQHNVVMKSQLIELHNSYSNPQYGGFERWVF